jgi:hypothetical protein
MIEMVPLLATTPITCLVVAFFAPRLTIAVPLFIACLFVLLSIPITSRRGKLSIPACVGIGLGAAALALAMGKLAGRHGVAGTTLGILVSALFFLLISAAVGSLLGLFFYREPPEE